MSRMNAYILADALKYGMNRGLDILIVYTNKHTTQITKDSITEVNVVGDDISLKLQLDHLMIISTDNIVSVVVAEGQAQVLKQKEQEENA